MYDKILVPTEGSKRAEMAAEEAIELAEALGSEVHFLYVVDSSVTAGLPEDAAWEQLEALLQDEGENVVSRLQDRAEESRVKTKGVVREGPPYREIVDYTEENDIDLIVIATAARKGLDRLLMGSTTERVIRHTDRPVTVIRGEEE